MCSPAEHSDYATYFDTERGAWMTTQSSKSFHWVPKACLGILVDRLNKPTWNCRWKITFNTENQRYEGRPVFKT